MSWISKLFGLGTVTQSAIQIENARFEVMEKVSHQACKMIKRDVESLLDDEILSKSISMAVDEIVAEKLGVGVDVYIDTFNQSEYTTVTIKRDLK